MAAYGIPPDARGNGGSLVGLQFAFRSMDYAKEVDSNIEAFHAQTGVYPATAGAYFDFHAQPAGLAAFLRAVHAKGCAPSVTLDPKYYGDQNPDPSYQKSFLGLIIAGKFDSQLEEWAATLRDFGAPVLLRFAHEMNGDWYPYGGGGDADGDGNPDGPDAFIGAWRHVHDLFVAQGAVNLLWVFCPNGEDFPDRGWNRPFRYYPGDAYTDLVFVDAYEHHDKRTQSLSDALEHFLSEMGEFLREREASGNTSLKPFGLGEFGTNRVDPEAKAAWYTEALSELSSDTRIQFHSLYDGQNEGERGTDDFSLRGLEGRLDSAYAQPAFRYRLFGPG